MSANFLLLLFIVYVLFCLPGSDCSAVQAGGQRPEVEGQSLFVLVLHPPIDETVFSQMLHFAAVSLFKKSEAKPLTADAHYPCLT